MRFDEIEAQALALSAAERAELARQLLASLPDAEVSGGSDPIFRIGSSPVEDDDTTDGSVNHDQHIYDGH